MLKVFKYFRSLKNVIKKMIYTKNSDMLYRMLNGLICVYKPTEVSLFRVCNIIKTNLCRELSELDSRPKLPQVVIEESNNNSLAVAVKPSYSDSDLVLGPHYQQADFKLNPSLPLWKECSGVALIGINHGTKLAYYMKQNYPTRAYRVRGQFGLATDTYFKDGKFVERSTFKHIKKERLDRLLASIQATHQKKKFEAWNVDIQSQQAYELAVAEHTKPDTNKLPLIYGIKCIEFNLPYFTLEIHSINEYEKYLHALIHDIGIQLRSTAHCTGVQCIRTNFFTTENALLKKHWTLQHILDNIRANKSILQRHRIKS